MPIQLFPVLVSFMLNAQTSTKKLSEFLGTLEVDNKRHSVQKVFVMFISYQFDLKPIDITVCCMQTSLRWHRFIDSNIRLQ